MSGLQIPQPWSFNADVAGHFTSHVRQSIPNYDEILRLFKDLIREWRSDAITIVDFGTGTGEALKALESVWQPGDRALGIDSAEEMLQIARTQNYGAVNPEFTAADLTEHQPPPFDAAVMTFTLSFLQPAHREPVLRSLHSASRPHGVLFFADKIRHRYQFVSDVVATDHRSFKINAGLTAAEVVAKSTSLEGVQQPWSLEAYVSAICQAGWTRPDIVHLSSGFFACVSVAAANSDAGPAPISG